MVNRVISIGQEKLPEEGCLKWSTRQVSSGLYGEKRRRWGSSLAIVSNGKTVNHQKSEE